MDCIYCGGRTRVINSRPQKADRQTWRRRQCLACQAIITSIECIKFNDTLSVQKRDGQIVPFSRDKLFLSIYHAVDHLNNPTDLATSLTSTVLRHLVKESQAPLIASGWLAGTTSQVLKRYDVAAAIRYLSFQTKLQSTADIKRSLRSSTVIS